MEPVREVRETEVMPRAKRRRFTAAEKLRVLRLADECAQQSGEIGALLRREGLYSSHLVTWRLARAAGELDGLTPKKRGPKTREANPLEKENAQLRQALAKSEARARRAEALVELQKKISELLGIAQPKDESL
jgi:transposase